jgi:GxxExxY protein
MSVTIKFLDELTYNVIGAAIEVHKVLVPGLLESVYHKCLKEELRIRNIAFESERPIQIDYKGVVTVTDLRCDFFIQNCLVVELKAVESMLPVHDAQLLTYMKLLKSPKGILINFNCSNIFKDGQKTLVNKFFNELN